METKNKKVNMSLPESLIATIKEMAKKEKRGFSGQVEYLLNYAIENMKVTVE
ncbi:MAG: hypothetical protein OEZ36_07630 [Spirochaetota bacterium]|nr:hypothetical protein [Spirochaetota bacterium]